MKNKSRNNENNMACRNKHEALPNDIGLSECNNEKQFSKKKKT